MTHMRRIWDAVCDPPTPAPVPVPTGMPSVPPGGNIPAGQEAEEVADRGPEEQAHGGDQPANGSKPADSATASPGERSTTFPPEILTNEEKPGVQAPPASNAVMGAATPPVMVPDSGVVPDYSTVAVMTAGKVEEKSDS